MKGSKITEAVHTGNQINEKLIINNEEINNINVGADASVRPEHKENTQKGITLLALIITIIVLLILSIVSVQLITKSGIIERAKQGVIKHKLEEIHENVKLSYTSLKLGNNLSVITMSDEIKKLQENKYKKYIEKVNYTSTKVFYKMTDKLDGKEYMIDIKTGEIGTYKDKLQRVEADESLWDYEGSNIKGYLGTGELLKDVIVPNVLKKKDGTEIQITNVTLSNINFEGTLTFSSELTINTGTLNNCTTVKNIEIGDNVTIQGAYGTFNNCAELTTVKMGRNIKMNNNTGWTTFFASCPKLESVTVESLSAVELNAFKNIGPALKGDIVINEGVTTIGSSAFEGCSNITSVSIPSTVTEIGLTAFKNCTNLKKAIIPESVKVIRYGAFTDCINMKQEVTIKSGVELGKTEKGYFESAFAGSGITKLIVEDEVKIPLREGTNCPNLKEIEIGDNVTIDGAYGTFNNCPELTTVKMGKNIKITDMWSNMTLFKNCPKLENVTVESLSEIAASAFVGTGPALKGDIVINEGVTTIGTSAFEGCSNITSVSIPSTVTEIGLTAFKNCTNLKKAIIPESVKVIRYGAFTDCINMKQEVTIKSGVELGKTEKGYFESAFAGSGITKLIVEDEVKIPLREGTNCPNLKEIEIGDNVTIDGAYGTFNNCPELTTVKMGKNIKITDMWSNMTLFKNCPKLENVTVESLSEIAASAFVGTGPALKGDIVINEGVTTIGTSAFEGCTSITSVSIPSTITTIGSTAFYNCTGLETINVDMTEAKWNAVTKGSNWNRNVNAKIVFK